jgi:hypothetical protein
MCLPKELGLYATSLGHATMTDQHICSLSSSDSSNIRMQGQLSPSVLVSEVQKYRKCGMSPAMVTLLET